MKYKSESLIKLVFITAILFLILAVFQSVEGFAAAPAVPAVPAAPAVPAVPAVSAPKIVNLYFGINTANIPILISSSAPGITLTSSNEDGVVGLSIPPNLGALQNYTAFGWATTTLWHAINATTKLDRGSGSLFIMSGGKTLHTPAYKASVQATSTTEARLPQVVSQIQIYSVLGATLGVVGDGDSSIKDAQGNKAKILIQLTF